MRQFEARGGARATQPVPLPVRFVGKLVLEVMPAALASVIGGFLLAHYQFGQPSAARPPVEPAGPASAEMIQLVHEEHAMIRDFLLAQRAAAKNRVETAAAQDARAAAAAKLARAAHVQETAHPVRTAEIKPAAQQSAAEPPAAPAAPLVVARLDPNPQPAATVFPAAAPPPRPSLVATTLAIPAHVIGVTLHAVSMIGGIPSWIGHRFGGEREFGERPTSAAS